MVTRMRVRVKKFKECPPGLDPLQMKYCGKIISVRKIPVAFIYEQVDKLNESKFGTWIYTSDQIESIRKGKPI